MSKPAIVPVLETKDLVRDTHNKALLATNHAQLTEHRQKKQLLSKLIRQSDEIDVLKHELKEIKSMLYMLTQSK
jgi:hypothetical protein